MSGEQIPDAKDPRESPTDIGEQDIRDQHRCDTKRSLFTRLVYPLEIFWLFSQSDFFTFVLPNTAFGILGALSGSRLTTDENVSVGSVLQRIPLVILFNWSNVFIFDLANQRLPESVSNPMGSFFSFHQLKNTPIPQ